MVLQPTHGVDRTGVVLPWSSMMSSPETCRRPHQPQANLPPVPPLLLLLLLLLSSILTPAAGGEDGELCVVETPVKTQFVRPVVETNTICHGCLFPRPPTPTPDNNTPPVRQVHIVHVDNPEGGAVEVVVAGREEAQQVTAVREEAQQVTTARIALVLHTSSGKPPVVFTITTNPLSNTTKHLLLVNGEDEVRDSNLQYSVVRQQQLSEEELISSTEQKFGFITSYTRVALANTILLHLPQDDESDEGCDTEIKDESPVAQCYVSVEQPISGCYHHNMLGENDRDIHIIEVDGSSNSNGSLVLAVVGSGEGGSRGLSLASGRGIERNITLVLRTSRPTTWSLHATSLQGTITLLVGGGDQVENTSVSGPGVMVEVRRFDVPATFDQLILTVLTSVGPPVSYTRTTTPNKITITVLPRIENHVVSSFIPDEQPTVYAEDVAAVIQAGLSVSCDEESMTVAIPVYISDHVGGITMSLGDLSCSALMNVSHIVIKEKFDRCNFLRRSSSYQTTYINYVNVELGPTISDDEDFAGSGYGSDDEYYAARIPPIKVECEVEPRPTYHHMPLPATQATYKKQSSSESSAGATYKMDIFRDSDYKIPIRSDDFPASTNINRRLYIRTALASVMPWTEAYDADLRVVLE
ncbi:hypothetical protein OTU49_002394, partial [Cherax quadricarinatus]